MYYFIMSIGVEVIYVWIRTTSEEVEASVSFF